MNSMILNRATGKIELHFDKSEYLALSPEQKTELKSAFLFSKSGSCWVSRAKEPNTYRAERVAEKLGFSGIEKQGERLSYAEQLDRKAERAEARADRYEQYAANAEQRGAALQKPLDSMRGDIAFFTQPIIAGHAGSQAFARARQRMYDKFDRGMDEYRKSGYYRDLAATIRAFSEHAELKDRVYLDNRIRECNKNLKDLQGRIARLDDAIYRINQGETVKAWDGSPLSTEKLEQNMEDVMGQYEAQQGKLTFFEDCINKLGGVKFSRENIKPGYIVRIARWGRCEVISAGPKNIQYKIVEPWADGCCLTDSYAAIEILEARGQKPTIENRYAEGDILTASRPGDDSIYRAFQVLKVTEKSVQIREINVENCIPQAGQFRLNSKPTTRRIVKSKFSDYVGVYYDDWQLNKWTSKEETV